MKIGLVSPYDFNHPGGVSEHLRNLAGQLRRLGHEVIILAPSNPAGAVRDQPGFHRIGRAIPIPANQSIARISLSFHMTRQLRQILKQERFEVLHFHEPLMPALPLTLLRMSNAAHVGTFHAYSRRNLGYYYGRPLFRPYFERLHCLIAVSRPARDFVAQYFPGEYEIIPNGVDTKTFAPDIEPLQWLRDGRVNILFVGRLERRKGLRYLLQAYAHVRQHVPSVRLILVGSGPLDDEVAEFIQRRRIPDVIQLGYVPPDQLPACYASADIFCSPATGKESFGLVLLEAMATGLPVVASDIEGYRQVLTAGREGLMVPAKQSTELAAALMTLATHAELRRRMGQAGLVTARHYSWNVVTERIIMVYRHAMALKAKEVQLVHQSASKVG